MDTRSLDPRHILSLARSVAAVGLIQPVAIDTSGRLIAGAHRLAVWGLLRIEGKNERRDAFLKGLEDYHRERPHAGLDGAVIEPDPLLANRSGAIIRKDRLGGLLTMYHRVAA